jgi:activator of 2-hydroxyglutaryl-CoA dehydratase
MLEMERAELEAAKTTARPELTKDCKVFFITAQIKLKCAVNATREDAENALKQILWDNYSEVVKIESILGE